MDRRRFLQMCGGGMVATATMAEVGFFAEFMAWVKRMPVWSIPKNPVIRTLAGGAQFTTFSGLTELATIYYDRKALDNLRHNFKMEAIEKPRALPEQREKSIQMLRFVQHNFTL